MPTITYSFVSGFSSVIVYSFFNLNSDSSEVAPIDDSIGLVGPRKKALSNTCYKEKHPQYRNSPTYQARKLFRNVLCQRNRVFFLGGFCAYLFEEKVLLQRSRNNGQTCSSRLV